MSWASNIPKELSVQPLPLVVLTGLDVKHNAIHKEIWDGFNARTNQRFRYKLLDGDHEYPKCKNKRPIEFYVPKGIFKTNWLNKHLYLVPSLVVVFFDLDWDEPNWKEKQMECATKVELVRHSLLDRNTRIILVLVQKHPSIPIDGDNMLTRERYPSLCAACSIKNNYLFLLHTELMHGYILKLEEDAFTEPTQTYYTLEIKSIRFKRDSLVKVTHQYLFVRLAIKIAFFSEMKQDIFKAIEFYKQAYLSTLDIRFYDSNILEVKMVASAINYKLCKLFFEIKHPIDAIDQFRKHIDIFKIKVGPADLSFEHSAWLAKQFQVMGELFESAIERGFLSAVQTQHPGFYFHSAANHCIQRRMNARELAGKQFPAASQWTSENPSPIDLINNLEFYGQRPWRQGQGMEVLDQQKETLGILCLQEIESKEILTPLITCLFKQAITHFQVFNCKRMKQYLSVCMAEEYYFAKDYQEALNIYVKVLNDYNNEHWWPIITSIMLNALKCAYLTADITNYCLLCTEIIGKNVLLSNDEKSLIQKNLLLVLSNEIPNASYHQIDAKVHSIELAKQRWTDELNKQTNSEPSTNASPSNNKQPSGTSSTTSIDSSQMLANHKIIPAHVYSMVPFVECKARFGSRVYNSNQHCELSVHIRVNCVESIQFSRLSVRFSQSHYNQYCQVDEAAKLVFEPNRVYSFVFEFLPCHEDIGKELEVSSITLELGSRDTRVLTMHWRGDCKNALAHENHTISSINRMALGGGGDSGGVIKVAKKTELAWDEINVAPITSIVAKKSNIELKLEHKMPIFVDEYYAIKLSIENKEENAIENITLSTEFQGLNAATNEIDNSVNAVDPKILRLWIGEIDKNTTAVQQIKKLPDIGPNQQFSDVIYIQIKDIKSANLLIRVKYDVDVSITPLSYDQKSPNERRSSRSKSVSSSKDAERDQRVEMVKCSCVQEDRLKLESMNAFKFDFSLMSMQMKPIRVARFGEPFLLMTEIRNQAPYALKFNNTFLNLAKGVRFKTSSSSPEEASDSFLKGEVLKPHEMATECFCLSVDAPTDSEQSAVAAMALGQYVVEWRRKANAKGAETSESSAGLVDDDEAEEDAEIDKQQLDVFYVKSSISLPELKLETFPFLIEAELPTFGTLDKELRIAYVIRNKMKTHAIELECMLDENEFFSISGKKLELMQILPNDSINYRVALFPLQVGYCKLPSLHAKVNGFVYKSSDETTLINSSSNPNAPIGLTADVPDPASLDSVIQNMVPAQIFIFPENIDSLIVPTKN